jgi:hypothetical protein
VSAAEVTALAAVALGCLLVGWSFGEHYGHRSRITATDPLDQVPQHTHN